VTSSPRSAGALSWPVGHSARLGVGLDGLGVDVERDASGHVELDFAVGQDVRTEQGRKAAGVDAIGSPLIRHNDLPGPLGPRAHTSTARRFTQSRIPREGGSWWFSPLRCARSRESRSDRCRAPCAAPRWRFRGFVFCAWVGTGKRGPRGATSGAVDACGCQLEVNRPHPESRPEPHIQAPPQAVVPIER